MPLVVVEPRPRASTFDLHPFVFHHLGAQPRCCHVRGCCRLQLDAQRTEQEASTRFAAEMERAVREQEAGQDVELPDDSRQVEMGTRGRAKAMALPAVVWWGPRKRMWVWPGGLWTEQLQAPPW